MITAKIDIPTLLSKLQCSYYNIKFFGCDFAPELRNSQHGFLLRANYLQENSILQEQFKKVYKGPNKLNFKLNAGQHID